MLIVLNREMLVERRECTAGLPRLAEVRAVQSMESNRKRVLVVDDDSVMASVVSHNLEMSGFVVTTASNGLEALELFDANRFDVLVTDYQMPGLNGEQLCQHVRQRTADVVLFLITAKGYELDVARLEEQFSLAGVFIKPFSPKELVKDVRAALNIEEDD